MSFAIIKKPRRRRPAPFLQPSKKSPFYRGLIAAIAHGSGFQMWTSEGVIEPVFISNTTPGDKISSNDGYLRYEVPSILSSGLTNCTVAAELKIRAESGGGAYGGFGLHRVGANGGRFGISTYIKDLYFNCDEDASLKNILASGVLLAHERNFIATRYDGTQGVAAERFKGYFNGIEYTDTDAFRSSLSTSYDRFYINAYGYSSQAYGGNNELYYGYIWERTLSVPEILALRNAPYQLFERRIWAPVEAGPPGPVTLNIDALRHARPVDQVDVTEVITIIPIDIDGLRHNRRVDSISLGVSVDLFLASLRHRRPVDAILLEVSVDLAIDALRHGRVVDVVNVQELVGIPVNITDQRHARPVDSLLLDVDQPILIDSLRHQRPVDAVGVQPLLGDQTGIGATASAWILDAGQSLNNAVSVDFDYHVLEGIFDSDQSLLGVDGSRVTGPAGMRELTALTLGANVDGQERVQGEIAELRIYAGALSQADRDRILQELQAKWITG